MGERFKVLLMDDSEIARSVVGSVLERGGFDVRAVSTLGEFNSLLKSWLPNVVLTDVNMPGVSGPDICRWIKGRLDTNSVPVVLMSELPEPILARLAETSGADAFLSKSEHLDTLPERISSLCEEIVW
jgi:CheY-like chemotaxis protein